MQMEHQESITVPAGASKLWGGALGPNGNIYCTPASADSVLIINPIAMRADWTSIAGLSSSATLKWMGGVFAPNGKLYGIPHSSTSVLIVDPAQNTTDRTSIANLAGDLKWAGGVWANGQIWGIPRDSSSVLIIDP